MTATNKKALPPDYDEKCYAGWLGKCIGVRFGAPLENWTYKEIKDNLGELTSYLPLPPGKVFKPDDDTSAPMILIRALQDFGTDITAQQMGDTLLNYLADQRGTLWWGGYGVSTEHTVYVNLANGIPAPESGSIALNGADLAEQIGGQIFSDIWGLVAPDNPELAADYAAGAASVTHDGEGILGGRFIAGLVSAAFCESDPGRLLEIGLSLIPSDSEYARVVQAVSDFHKQHPEDWHEAYRFIADNFGYDRYPGVVHIIPNAGIIAMALLYGGGDFSRSIQIANMGGWDTDCNVGNVGAIMGVAVALSGIPTHWREPVNDELITAGIIGTRNLWDIPACADLFSALGRQIAGVEPLPSRPRYQFNYPGATHSFRQRSGGRGRIIDLKQVDNTEGGGLQAIVRKLNKKGEVRFFVKTYLRPDELSANYYSASFSPKIYPGQMVRASLSVPEGLPDLQQASLYVWDSNGNQGYQAVGQPLQPGTYHELNYQIPELHNTCLSEVGIVLRTLGQPWNGSVILDWLDWDGFARFSNDFALERPEYGAISQWTFLRGFWRLADGGYHGSGVGINETYTGDVLWRDYTVSVRLIPLLGDFHNINVRVQGALRSYALGLAPEDKLVLYKNDRGYRPVASTGFSWQHGRSYTMALTTRGNRLLASVDGEQKLAWDDEENAYRNGQIGLSNFAGCHTRYESMQVS
ncbi:MAG: ADP-ribosylglycohydrolase family protein [Chloroflexi bacterium]|nr:ADP-ribosylglycohydrolase family protein [Chloroflexota bacterium]